MIYKYSPSLKGSYRTKNRIKKSKEKLMKGSDAGNLVCVKKIKLKRNQNDENLRTHKRNARKIKPK